MNKVLKQSASTRPELVMKEWFSARELAKLQLNGFPKTKMGILKMFKRTDGLSPDLIRKRSAVGGGYEYHWTLLPQEAQAELVRRRHALTVKASHDVVSASEANGVVQRDAQKTDFGARAEAMRDARAMIVLEVKRRCQVHNYKTNKAATQLIADLKLRSQDLPTSDEGAVWGCDYDKILPSALAANGRGKLPSLRSLHNWLAEHKKGGVAALAPIKKREKVPLTKLEWFPHFMRYYARPQKPSLVEAYRNFVADCGPEEDVPSYHAVRHAVNKLGAVERHRGREGALALKNRMAFVARDTSDLIAGTIYTADGKTFDAEIENLFSKQPFKPEITSVLDVATR